MPPGGCASIHSRDRRWASAIRFKVIRTSERWGSRARTLRQRAPCCVTQENTQAVRQHVGVFHDPHADSRESWAGHGSSTVKRGNPRNRDGKNKGPLPDRDNVRGRSRPVKQESFSSRDGRIELRSPSAMKTLRTRFWASACAYRQAFRC